MSEVVKLIQRNRRRLEERPDTRPPERDDVPVAAQFAAQITSNKKARAVGAANGRNPISIIVPCHRVVGSNGSLTGFAAGLDSKAFLLDLERWQPTKVS